MPEPSIPDPFIHVLVGILSDSAGRVLIAQRPEGRPLAGAWEFPGGKRKRNETRLQALRRELAEELHIDVLSADPLLDFVHEYPEQSVRLDVWWVHEYRGHPQSGEGQALRWVAALDLANQPILAADLPIIEAICARQAPSA